MRYNLASGSGGVAQTQKLTATLTRDTVQNWSSQGVTRQMLVNMRDTYLEAIDAGQAWANAQIGPRLDLMNKALELWPEDYGD